MHVHSAITRRVLVLCANAAGCQVQVIEDATRAWMFETVVCSSVREAEDLLTEKDFAIIFCEDRFKDEGYADLLAMVERQYKVPVVVMVSGVDEDSVFREAMALGAFNVMPNPCSTKDVLWMVVRAAQQGTSSNPALSSRNAATPPSNRLPRYE